MQRVWSVSRMKPAEKEALAKGEELYPKSMNDDPPSPWPKKPRTASECDAITEEIVDEKGKTRVVGLGQPGYTCPFVSCVWHTAIAYSEATGAYSIDAKMMTDDGDPVPLLALDEAVHSCARKAAAEGPWNLEYIGSTMGITRERVRQIVDNATSRIRYRAPKTHLRVLADHADVELPQQRGTPSVGDVWHRVGDLTERVIVENTCPSGTVAITYKSGRKARMQLKKFTNEFVFFSSKRTKKSGEAA